MYWYETAKRLRFEEGKSWTQIAKALQSEFPDLTEHEIHEKVRRKLRREPEYQNTRFVYTDKRHFYYEFDHEIHLYPGGDWHLGAHGCKERKILQYLDKVYADPIGYLILIGDLSNNSTKDSKGSAYMDVLTPRVQKERIMCMLDRFAKEGRILFMCSANHEKRTFDATGQDLMYDIAVGIGSLDRYNFTDGFIHIKIGNKKYNIYATHNLGKSEARLKSKSRNYTDVDLLIGGHIHDPKVIPTVQQCSNGRTREIKTIIVPAWVQDEDYAINAGYELVSMANPVVILGEELRVMI